MATIYQEGLNLQADFTTIENQYQSKTFKIDIELTDYTFENYNVMMAVNLPSVSKDSFTIPIMNNVAILPSYVTSRCGDCNISLFGWDREGNIKTTDIITVHVNCSNNPNYEMETGRVDWVQVMQSYVDECIARITPTIDPDNKHWLLGGVDTGIIAEGHTDYNLPIASDSVVGGIAVGEGLKIENGVLSIKDPGSEVVTEFTHKLTLSKAWNETSTGVTYTATASDEFDLTNKTVKTITMNGSFTKNNSGVNDQYGITYVFEAKKDGNWVAIKNGTLMTTQNGGTVVMQPLSVEVEEGYTDFRIKVTMTSGVGAFLMNMILNGEARMPEWEEKTGTLAQASVNRTSAGGWMYTYATSTQLDKLTIPKTVVMNFRIYNGDDFEQGNYRFGVDGYNGETWETIYSGDVDRIPAFTSYVFTRTINLDANDTSYTKFRYFIYNKHPQNTNVSGYVSKWLERN